MLPRAARHHARAAAHEPLRHPRPLPAGVRPHRRADAARPVPRLHGRRAHPDGDPQPAPLHRGAARARVPAVLAADRRLRAPGSALPRRAVPRHRQGPRRRPLGARRARRAPLLPRARPAGRGRRARRVAGRAAPDDVGDRAEAGHLATPTWSRRSRRRVGSERRLVALYLLTVADIRGTSPKVWNAWKAQLLEDLFHATRARLAGAAGGVTLADSLLAAAARRRSGCCGCTRCRTAPSDALWSHLDNVYFQRHTADEIAWHARHLHWRVRRHARRSCGRGSRAPRRGCRWWSTCPTSKSLFARISGFFGRRGLSIVEAKIHTTRHGYALDTFTVHDPAESGRVVPRRDPARRVRAGEGAEGAAAARAAGRRPREPAAEALPADARGADLPRRQGDALHPGDRRRRPARAARERSPTRSPRRTSTS